MKTLESRKEELTKEAKRLFKNGGTFETVYEGLKEYREKNGLSHDINLDAIQYLANPIRNKKQNKKKMKKLIVNIGMKNNSKGTFKELTKYVENLKEYKVIEVLVTVMTYEGEDELTMIATFEHNYSRDSKVLSDWENIASVLTQDCIAISSDTMDALAFSPNFKGKNFKFDSNLFANK